MIEFRKTYKDRFRRKGPRVSASIGLFEAHGKNKTEAREAIEKDLVWYAAQNPTPQIRLAPDGSAWVLVADTHGYSYYIQRGPRFPGSSHMNVKDAARALECMLTHMCDSYPEETWDSFLYGVSEPVRERIREEIHRREEQREEISSK